MNERIVAAGSRLGSKIANVIYCLCVCIPLGRPVSAHGEIEQISPEVIWQEEVIATEPEPAPLQVVAAPTDVFDVFNGVSGATGAGVGISVSRFGVSGGREYLVSSDVPGYFLLVLSRADGEMDLIYSHNNPTSQLPERWFNFRDEIPAESGPLSGQGRVGLETVYAVYSEHLLLPAGDESASGGSHSNLLVLQQVVASLQKQSGAVDYTRYQHTVDW